MNKKLIIFGLLALAVFGALFFIPGPEQESQEEPPASSQTIMISAPGCEHLDLVMTADCLHKEIVQIFDFRIRDDVERTLEDIKANGGDCYDYNLLYEKWMKDLGFNAEMFQYVRNNETSHVFTIAYDENYYCILDQTVEPHCVILGEDDGEN